jgi:sigma-B regulation protein RsbU (phosphoserine phosphatase)
MFTALCLLGLRVGGAAVRFTNAGLPHPLLRRDGSVEALSFDGPRLPLGSMPELQYGEQEIALQPGDVLVVYTDGLSEAMDGGRRFYGSERLEELLAQLDTAGLDAASIKHRILDDVQRFTGGAPRHDDMTVVVVKVIASE